MAPLLLQEKRAAYGEQIVATLSQQLIVEYGDGYSRASLFRMIQLNEMFQDKRIVASLVRQLSWTHFAKASCKLIADDC